MELDISGNGHIPQTQPNETRELDELREQLLIEHNRNLNTLADFKNYRRNIENNSIKITEEKQRALVLPLLDVVDDLEKAIQNAGDVETPSLQGVRIIHQKFLTLLKLQGVLPFESVGTIFDPDLHEAISIDEHKGNVPGIIVDEMRRGYRLNNILLRAAQVRVAPL